MSTCRPCRQLQNWIRKRFGEMRCWQNEVTNKFREDAICLEWTVNSCTRETHESKSSRFSIHRTHNTQCSLGMLAPCFQFLAITYHLSTGKRNIIHIYPSDALGHGTYFLVCKLTVYCWCLLPPSLALHGVRLHVFDIGKIRHKSVLWMPNRHLELAVGTMSFCRRLQLISY